ncbi:MAG: class B sortase [Clostridia bacterium]|nr:class B sortase [Clostridia bacterium]
MSYPVVQWTDNEYYTTHLVSGEENKSGAIFLDFLVDSSPAVAPNFILYGHNMNDKTMFHNIRDLFVEETFRDARVEYICDEGVFVYDSLSVYVTYTDDLYYLFNFYEEAEFTEFFEERAAKSRFAV